LNLKSWGGMFGKGLKEKKEKKKKKKKTKTTFGKSALSPHGTQRSVNKKKMRKQGTPTQKCPPGPTPRHWPTKCPQNKGKGVAT